MLNSVSKTKKILICLSLVIIVAGAFIFGFLGFNADREERTDYRVIVSVDGYADAEKLDNAKSVTENYFKEIGVSPYSVVKLNDGATYSYSFSSDYSDKIQVNEIKNRVSEVTTGVYNVEAGVYKVEPQPFVQSLYVILAGAIAVVASAVLVFITERFAGAFTVICSSVFASLLTSSLIAVTRTPAGNYAYATVAGAAVITAIAACGVLSRCREIMRNVSNDKMSYSEVSEKAVKDSTLRFVFLFSAILIVAVALFAFGSAQIKTLALQILLSDVAAAVTTFATVSVLWAAFKGARKKQARKQTESGADNAQTDKTVAE